MSAAGFRRRRITAGVFSEAIVRAPREQIAQCEAWLRAEGIAFRTTATAPQGFYTIHFAKSGDAVRFKLTWGGNI